MKRYYHVEGFDDGTRYVEQRSATEYVIVSIHGKERPCTVPPNQLAKLVKKGLWLEVEVDRKAPAR